MKPDERLDLRRFQGGYLLFFAAVSAFGGYAVPFLEARHIPSAQIGVLMATMMVAGVLGQGVNGYLCDRYGTIRRFFYPMLFLMTAFFVLLTRGTGFGSLLAGLLGVGVFQYALMALMDSWVLESTPFVKARYGNVRAWGSLGWAGGALLTGWVVDRWGWGAAPLIFGVFGALFIAVTWRMPDCDKSMAGDSGEPVSWESVLQLLGSRRYQHLTAVFMLIFMAQYIIYSYSMILISRLGGSNFHMGLFMFVICLFEFPAFFVMNRFIIRFGAASVLRASAGFYVLRGCLVFLCGAVWQVILMGFFQTITYAAFMSASKYLVDEFCPPQLKTTSQMVAMAAYTGGSGFFAYLSAGVLADVIGVRGLMLLAAAIAAAALGLCIGYIRIYYPTLGAAAPEER